MRFLFLPLLLLLLLAPALAQMKFVLHTRISSANGIATRRSTTRVMPIGMLIRRQGRQESGSGSSTVMAA